MDLYNIRWTDDSPKPLSGMVIVTHPADDAEGALAKYIAAFPEGLEISPELDKRAGRLDMKNGGYVIAEKVEDE